MSNGIYIKNLEQLSLMLQPGSVKPIVGKQGGRKFECNYNKQLHCFKMKELMRQTLALAESASRTASKTGLEHLREIRDRLVRINKEGNDLLKKSSRSIRFKTAIRRFFGNLFFSRKATWKKINRLVPALKAQKAVVEVSKTVTGKIAEGKRGVSKDVVTNAINGEKPKVSSNKENIPPKTPERKKRRLRLKHLQKLPKQKHQQKLRVLH